jgi:5-methylcytosine-specific restriction endonuclease McrA
MTWGNYGRHGWHIDHRIPISAFNFKAPTDIDFKKCWALSNLQPLWSHENQKKYNKLLKPFQPSLNLQLTY